MNKLEHVLSKVDPDKVIHLVHRKEDFSTQGDRRDIIHENHFIQLSTLRMNAGKNFKPHKHIWKTGTDLCIAQESWVVVSGSVKVYFYDLDDSLLYTTTLNPGDASITLEGGHTYEILSDETLVYEYKTGPYQGQALDKVFIDESKD